MNELALFAGAGGGILGGKLLGWRTICAVEWDAHAAGVLVARQNDGCLEAFPIWDDVRSFDGLGWRGRVDVVSGGFPCQDISCAGKGAGIDGERSGMWVEMARIVGEVGPRYVLVENSPMLTVRGLGRVLGDLVALGYDAVWGVLGADDAGAPHRRKRIWVLGWRADADSGRQHKHKKLNSGEAQDSSEGDSCGEHADRLCDDVANDSEQRWGSRRTRRSDSGGAGESEQALQAVAYADCGRFEQRDAAVWAVSKPDTIGAGEFSDADGAGCEQQWRAVANGAEQFAAECGGWWSAEPDVGRVADGVAARVDRLRCLGNGQVPAVVRLAWETLEGIINQQEGDES